MLVCDQLYVKMRSAPALRMLMRVSSTTLFSSSHPLAHAAFSMAYSPLTWYAAMGCSADTQGTHDVGLIFFERVCSMHATALTVQRQTTDAATHAHAHAHTHTHTHTHARTRTRTVRVPVWMMRGVLTQYRGSTVLVSPS